MFRPKIGLALGGGGPKGFAHIGVIKVLEKNNIPIDYIAGTSAGALVGGMYAYTKNSVSLEEYFASKNWLQMLSYFVDPSFKGGFIQGNRLDEFLQGYLNSVTFDKLSIPFRATAVNLNTGKLVELQRGKVTPAIRASCAIPMLFKPVEIDNELYVDGGLQSSVPVQTVKNMGADIVIAVQLNKYYDSKLEVQALNMFEIGELSLQIVERKIADIEVKDADILIKPKVSHVHWNHFIRQEKRENGIILGEEAAEKSIDKIKMLSSKKTLPKTIISWISKITELFSANR